LNVILTTNSVLANVQRIAEGQYPHLYILYWSDSVMNVPVASV